MTDSKTKKPEEPPPVPELLGNFREGAYGDGLRAAWRRPEVFMIAPEDEYQGETADG